MPSYDFECLDCQERYTVFTSWKDKANAVCPKCGSANKAERFADYRVSSGSRASFGGGGCKPTVGGG